MNTAVRVFVCVFSGILLNATYGVHVNIAIFLNTAAFHCMNFWSSETALVC